MPALLMSQPAETLDRRIDAGARLSVIGYVRCERHRLAAVISDRGSDLVDRIAGKTVDDDLRTFARELQADGFADARSSAGYDCDFSL
jgi:hypothetical protein